MLLQLQQARPRIVKHLHKQCTAVAAAAAVAAAYCMFFMQVLELAGGHCSRLYSR
jgi:hypothetical protein